MEPQGEESETLFEYAVCRELMEELGGGLDCGDDVASGEKRDGSGKSKGEHVHKDPLGRFGGPNQGGKEVVSPSS